MDINKIKEIVKKYEVEKIELSNAFRDGGLDPLWLRFERAVENQVSDGAATLSRYGIWANTVRDNIIEAISQSERGELNKSIELLIKAANSMSAFADVQYLIDSKIEKNETIEDMWIRYNEYSKKICGALGRTSNTVGEYAEYLAQKLYGGKLVNISGASVDIVSHDGTRYQVKSRKVKNSLTTQLNVIRSWDFDYLVVILFDVNGLIVKGLEVPVAVAREYGVKNEHQNGWIITTSKSFITEKRSKDITINLSSLNKKSIL